MTFLYKGAFTSLAYNFLLAMITIQWSLLVIGVIAVMHKKENPVINWNENKVELDIVSLINADFAAAAVLISMGAVVGKLTHAQMFFMIIVEVFMYGVNF